MFQIHLPHLKKYQNIAGIAGIIGFLLGIVIPGSGFLFFGWHCPFGNGLFQIVVFLAMTGIISALIIGNLVGFLLIRFVKYQQNTQNTSGKEGDIDGN